MGRVQRGARARVHLRWLSVPLTGYKKEKKSRMRLKRLALMAIQVCSHAVAVMHSGVLVPSAEIKLQTVLHHVHVCADESSGLTHC